MTALVPIGGRIDLAAGQVYLYTEPLSIPSGTVLDGHGATIEVPQGDSSDSLGVITASHAKNITVKNLRIRCNAERSPNSPQRGIFFDHVTDSTISNVVIDSPRTSGIRLHHGCTGNTIEQVTVTMKLDPVMAGEPGIPVDEELVGIGLVSATADQYNGLYNESLDRTLALPATTLDNKVLNCRIYGGKHGIMLYNANRNTLSGNSISWTSHRGILMSPTADDNVAEWNDIREYGSTGIHMAWGASRNTIRYNSISSDHTIWQRDGIKGYLGTNDNLVEYNTIGGNNVNGIRFAAGAQGNVVRHNLITGAQYPTVEQQQVPPEIHVTIPTTGNIFEDNVAK
ncbi:right-handed parallel beta-helix repeat-containing protein [Geomonas oryzisoli]|uniref:Right-handed parallel beta-helix repeat-containing protein n=1 Tax=Geomonas oryzisoli TaxID=2847992 RepID=A0ABX8J9Y9_9BACT|nr:right-handed parallel beta-helix repeat-containing protein [Geomonas oryzisoli]QWV94806.1 right-handed parallel beta-helix repeat-containing protein [Geomonas oryzisoli]